MLVGRVVSEADIVRGFQVCQYNGVGALAFTLHDQIAALEEEVEEIWKQPWSNLKLLYLFLRWLSFGSQTIAAAIYFTLPPGPTANLSACRFLVLLQGIASQLLMVGVQVILILRVQALYHEAIFLRHFLRILFLCEIIVMIVIITLTLPEIQFGAYCTATSFPVKSAGFFLPPLVLDTLLFVLTMIKFYQAVRDGWGRESVMSRFLKDGIWAFALPFTSIAANLCCLTFISGALSSVLYSHLLRSDRQPTHPDCDIADTQILTSHFHTDPGIHTYELNTVQTWEGSSTWPVGA
ncbi:hypothetical protein BD779DRAFT_14059 [Infundibulicybe gibba]|nr:hypothetical protein BD779DRAFT_14059 [Infundibulicybe gibba]